MILLTLRIIEKILIIYFTLYFLVDILMYFYSLGVFFFHRYKKIPDLDYASHPISIVVPSYNEEVSIITCTDMLSELDYPDFEVIVVNDGSTDHTMQVLEDYYDLTPRNFIPENQIQTSHVKNIYDVKGKNIVIIDKENGGKADAVNTGINYSKGKYICTIDADSVLDMTSLKAVIEPFIRQPETIVSGGQLAVANDVQIENNRIISSHVPKNIWVQWQILEYIKSFLISRMAFSKINALLIMSGAFSVFKKADLTAVGGFLSKQNRHPYIENQLGKGLQTVCEDMEIVVRLWQYKRDLKQKAKAQFVPEAVCWTEVPESSTNLFKQRSRWHQGLGETLKIHRKMLFEPHYGTTGLLGLPYYLFFEFLSPVIKIFSLIFVIVAAYYGILNLRWVILLLLSIMLTTAFIMSSITLVIEYWSQKNEMANRDALRYKTFADWIWLLISGILSEFTYSFFKIAAQINGILAFMKKKHEWNKFERKGI